jgi:hypothetical protein
MNEYNIPAIQDRISKGESKNVLRTASILSLLRGSCPPSGAGLTSKSKVF